MARRPRQPGTAALGIREALIAKLREREVHTFDPRLHLIPREEWPDPLPPYTDPGARLLNDLVAGKAVNVAAWDVRRLADFPRDWHRVRIDVDGALSRAEYHRTGTADVDLEPAAPENVEC